jgi:glyoxylase-like metal-dependent hydrolase (beta-lactamase superfamily II)
MEIYAIETGNFKLDGGAMFGVVPKSMWGKAYPSDENNLCTWSMRSMLIDTGEHKVLIDNGIGEKLDEKSLRHFQLQGDFSLEKSLNKYGYRPEDITDVILTHLHFDHCGGSIKYNENKELVPAFPNAMFHTSRQQWDWAMKPNPREKPSFIKENIEPILENGKLNLFETDQELLPGISVKILFGHTEGQVVPYIRTKDKTIVFCADFIPSMAHVPLSFIAAYDIRPLVSLKEKKEFLEEALDKNYILFFEHDAYHECCTLHLTGKGPRAKESFTLNQYFGRDFS